MTTLAIEANDIGRRFGSTWALRDATLTVAHGEIVGLRGANGSGKSTLLRVLATHLRPHAGAARVCGHDVVDETDDVRSVVGYLAPPRDLFGCITARENLALAAVAFGRDERDVDHALDRVGLLPAAESLVHELSAGMQRRLSLARLMLMRPRLLLLDEPYSNREVDDIRLLDSLLGEWSRAGVAALVVLDEPEPAPSALHRTLTMHDGRIAASPVVHGVAAPAKHLGMSTI